jgi:hypothetical protein
MSETIGLIIFAAMLTVLAVLLVDYFRKRERVEIDEAFAQARGWEYRDALPQFGRAQRQRVLSPADLDPFPWELIILLPQAGSSATVPVSSTVWRTTRVRLERGVCVIGPPLSQPIGQIDLSSPIVSGLFRLFLGDDALQLANLQQVLLPDTARLTVLATDPQQASDLLKDEMIDQYDAWLNRFPDEGCFPVLLLNETELQFKVRKALTKASDVDSFVEFCIAVTSSMPGG